MSKSPLSPIQLSFASALSPFAMVVVAPLLPELGRVFAADENGVQFVISAYLLGLALAQLVLGPVSDRFGRRPVLITSLVIYAIVSLICAAAPSLPVLIAARFVQACAAAGTAAICRAAVHDVHRGDTAAHYLAYIAAAHSVSHTLAPMVGGFVGAIVGWRGLFVALAVAGLVMAIHTARTLPETRLASGGGARFGIGHVLSTNLIMLRMPLFFCYALIYGLTGAGYYGFLAVAPGYFATRFGIGGATFGLSWSFMAVAFFIGAVLSARLVKPIGRARLTDASLAGSLLVGLSMPLCLAIWGATPVTLIGPLVVLSLTLGISSPLVLSAALGIDPTHAGTASGLMGSLAMGCAALLTPLAAAAYDGEAYSMVWPITATMVIMALLRCISLPLERKRTEV
jgi:DHA1 family bicyclomycin/chloramphenicol resistance-like MFS transporter